MGKIVGMSRNIKLEWLDKTAELVREYTDEQKIKEQLNEYLAFYISSPTNLRKTREILLNIWVRNKNFNIKKIANECVNSGKESNRFVAHWCMMLTSYQIFADISIIIGSLYDKQYQITTAKIKEKVFDKWGDRTTLLHSVDKIIQTLNNFHVIERVSTGKFDVMQTTVASQEVMNLLVLTILTLSDKLYMSYEEINQTHIFFPFEYYVDQSIMQSDFFTHDNFGGEVVISLRDM